MKKILILLIIAVVIGGGLWLISLYSENSGKEKSVATKEEALPHDPMVIAKKPPGKSTDAMVSGKDTANAEQGLKTTEAVVNPGVQDLITLIEDKKADPEKRKDNFERLKNQYPAEALAFARVKAEEYSSTNRDLLMRMSIGERRGVLDKEAEGDYDIGSLSVYFVMEEGVKKYPTPAEKAKYLIRTALSKGWTGGMPRLKPYCDYVDESDKTDFSPGEDEMYVALCHESCDDECLTESWKRHESDWSAAAILLKKRIVMMNCKSHKGCNIDAFFKRLQEPDDPENNVYLQLIQFLVSFPRLHCIPFEDMMKKAEKTGNTRFVETLIKSEHKYREKQRNCFNQQ